MAYFWQLREAALFALSSLSEQLLEAEVYIFLCYISFLELIVCAFSSRVFFTSFCLFLFDINFSVQDSGLIRVGLRNFLEQIITEDTGLGGSIILSHCFPFP